VSFKRADQMKRDVYVVKFQRKYRMLVIKVENAYSVLSLNSTAGAARQYTVRWDGERFTCNCPDYTSNGKDKSYTCKHIEAVFLTAAKMGESAEVEVNGRVRKEDRSP
jgi:hypothetical protein